MAIELPKGEIVLNSNWGITTTIEETPEGIVSRTYQDYDPILEDNKAQYTSGDKGDLRGKWGRKIASIPLAVYLEWKQKFGIDALNKDHIKGVRRLLDSNEYLYLRTAPGAL